MANRNVTSEKAGAVLSGLLKAVESVPKISGQFFTGVAHGAGMFGPRRSPEARAERVRRSAAIRDVLDNRTYLPQSAQGYTQYLRREHPNTETAAEVLGDAALVGGLAKKALAPGWLDKAGTPVKKVHDPLHKVKVGAKAAGLGAAINYGLEPAQVSMEEKIK